MDSRDTHFNVCLWTAQWISPEIINEIMLKVDDQIEESNRRNISLQLYRIVVEHASGVSTLHIDDPFLRILGEKKNSSIRLSARYLQIEVNISNHESYLVSEQRFSYTL